MRGPTSWGDGESGPGGGRCLKSSTLAMHCNIAWGHWAVQLVQCTASLPGGIGQWTSCNALPHCLEAVGSATRAMHCLTFWGQCIVELMSCTATPPGGSGQWNSCIARAHQLGGREFLPRRRSLPKERYSCSALPSCRRGTGQCNSCYALPHCLWAVSSGAPAVHRQTACGEWAEWALQLLQCTAAPPGGNGQGKSCNARAHQLGGREFLPRRRSLPKERYSCSALPSCQRGTGQCNSCYALPHCLWAVSSGARAVHRQTACGEWAEWAVQLLQCTAAPPAGNGQGKSCNARAHQLGARGVLPRRRSLPTERNSCNALPHCLGQGQWAVDLLAMHCLTSWG